MKNKILMFMMVCAIALSGSINFVNPVEKQSTEISNDVRLAKPLIATAAYYNPASQVISDYVNGANSCIKSIDISGCNSFSQIVDKKLSKGMAYANVTIGGNEALLVTDSTWKEDGKNYSYRAIVYMYKNGKPVEIGKLCSGGTADPIATKDGYIFSADHHRVCKFTIHEGRLFVKELATDVTKNGTTNYGYYSEDPTVNTNIDNNAAAKKQRSLFDQMSNGKTVNFTVK